MYDNLYCQCFLELDSFESRGELCAWLNRILHGKLIPYPFDSIETPWGILDVRRNRSYGISKGTNSDPLDDFLYWRYYLDIEPAENVPESAYIQNLRKFIHELKKQGVRVVPACEFEDELM